MLRELGAAAPYIARVISILLRTAAGSCSSPHSRVVICQHACRSHVAHRKRRGARARARHVLIFRRVNDAFASHLNKANALLSGRRGGLSRPAHAVI